MSARRAGSASTRSSSFGRAAVVFPTASVIFGASLVAVGGGSVAMAESCPTGSTLVSAGVCEVVFTSTPVSNWTPPAGTTKLQALLVGGGGAGGYSNADVVGLGGGGGGVMLVDLASTGDVTVVVGAGRTAILSVTHTSSVTQGGTTTTADAGTSGTGTTGGVSPSYRSTGYGGAGAGGTTSTNAGGVGLVVSALPGAASSLFAGDTTCYGGGGAAQGAIVSCGGGNVAEVAPQSDPAQSLPRANSGGGGGATYAPFGGGISVIAQDGADGIVVLRFSGATLPDTGTKDLSAMAWTAAGSLIVGAGALALAARLSARRRSRQL